MKEKDSHHTISPLLKLIDDPDETVYQKVREEILLHNITILPLLDEANQHSLNPIVNQRIAELTSSLYDQDLYSHFFDWIQNSENQFENGLFLTSRLFIPTLKKENFLQNFSALHTDIWREMNDSLTALEKIKIINHILFNVYSFKVIPFANTSPEHFCISNILHLKETSEMGITALYLWIAEKINLTIQAVLLPQKTILAFYFKPSLSRQKAILFYISPSDSGSVFTKKEIERYLEEGKVEKEDSYFNGISTKAFFYHYLSIIEQKQNLSIIQDIKELIHNNNKSYEKNN